MFLAYRKHYIFNAIIDLDVNKGTHRISVALKQVVANSGTYYRNDPSFSQFRWISSPEVCLGVWFSEDK